VAPVPADYLQPYLNAARTHGAGFPSLLWASAHTQRLRFDAITRMVDCAGKFVLDVGCGRADFLDHLHAVGQKPLQYIGIEAVPELASAARAKTELIVQADFIAEPKRLFVGADVIVFSGSLNTCDDDSFYRMLDRALDAANLAVVFNFLSSERLASADHLFWRKPADVIARLAPSQVTRLDDYLLGDTTMRVFSRNTPASTIDRPE
jgi:SAM-dependent methyltransferase